MEDSGSRVWFERICADRNNTKQGGGTPLNQSSLNAGNVTTSPAAASTDTGTNLGGGVTALRLLKRTKLASDAYRARNTRSSPSAGAKRVS